MSFTGILLAAGSSRRFGSDKRYYQLPGGDGMALHSARRFRSVLDDVLVVLRPEDCDLAEQMQQVACRVACNPDHLKGLGSSIRCGVQASQQSAGWLIMPADLPWLQAETIRLVVDRLSLQDGIILLPSCQEKRGHPVGFSARFKNALLELPDDGSGKQLIAHFPESLIRLDVDDAGIYRDVDFVTDIQ